MECTCLTGIEGEARAERRGSGGGAQTPKIDLAGPVKMAWFPFWRWLQIKFWNLIAFLTPGDVPGFSFLFCTLVVLPVFSVLRRSVHLLSHE